MPPKSGSKSSTKANEASGAGVAGGSGDPSGPSIPPSHGVSSSTGGAGAASAASIIKGASGVRNKGINASGASGASGASSSDKSSSASIRLSQEEKKPVQEFLKKIKKAIPVGDIIHFLHDLYERKKGCPLLFKYSINEEGFYIIYWMQNGIKHMLEIKINEISLDDLKGLLIPVFAMHEAISEEDENAILFNFVNLVIKNIDTDLDNSIYKWYSKYTATKRNAILELLDRLALQWGSITHGIEGIPLAEAHLMKYITELIENPDTFAFVLEKTKYEHAYITWFYFFNMIAFLSKSNTELASLNSSCKVKIQELESKIKKMKEVLLKQLQKNQETEEALAQARYENAQSLMLAESHKKALEEIEELKLLYQTYLLERVNLRSENSVAEAQIHSLRTELEEMRKYVAAQEKKNSDLESFIFRLKSAEYVDAEIEAYRSQIVINFEQEKETLRKELLEYKDRATKSLLAFAERDNTIRDLEGTIAKKNEEIIWYKNYINTLNEKHMLAFSLLSKELSKTSIEFVKLKQKSEGEISELYLTIEALAASKPNYYSM